MNDQFQPGYPQQPPHSNRGLVVGLSVALGALALVLIGVLAFLGGSGRLGAASGGGSSTPLTVVETQTLARQAEPQQQAAQEQRPYNACPYSNYSPDNGVTTGPFSANVYSAFMQACAEAGGPNVNVSAYSPAKGFSYSMSCSGSGTVYCRGGNNAVVRIW